MLAFFKKVAPWLAAGAQFIPGGGPAIAGIINKVAADAGHDDVKADPTVDSISNAVAAMSGNADAMLKLKAADQAYAEQMQQIGFKQIEDMESLSVQDRANARAREIQVRDNTPRNLAYAYAIGFFVTLGAEIWMAMSGHPINPLAEKSVDILLGVLTGMVLGTKEYYFGSSSGQDRQTELLAQSSPATKG